jgi:hypothetical protein
MVASLTKAIKFKKRNGLPLTTTSAFELHEEAATVLTELLDLSKMLKTMMPRAASA